MIHGEFHGDRWLNSWKISKSSSMDDQWGYFPHLGKFQVKRKVVAPESKSAVGKEQIPALEKYKLVW